MTATGDGRVVRGRGGAHVLWPMGGRQGKWGGKRGGEATGAVGRRCRKEGWQAVVGASIDSELWAPSQRPYPSHQASARCPARRRRRPCRGSLWLSATPSLPITRSTPPPPHHHHLTTTHPSNHPIPAPTAHHPAPPPELTENDDSSQPPPGPRDDGSPTSDCAPQAASCGEGW